MREILKLGQCSLEAFQVIVVNDSRISDIRIISHEVSINWRQAYADEKMAHLQESFDHTIPIENSWLARDAFLNLKLADLEKTSDHIVWSINSKVRCFGTEGYHAPYFLHIPMMNFHLAENATEDDMYASIRHICPNQVGAVLSSGRYYHYYGTKLLTEDEWHKFLGEFLMPCILVSPRYVGHALNDGYCSLRLTNDSVFKPKIPVVISVL